MPHIFRVSTISDRASESFFGRFSMQYVETKEPIHSKGCFVLQIHLRFLEKLTEINGMTVWANGDFLFAPKLPYLSSGALSLISDAV